MQENNQVVPNGMFYTRTKDWLSEDPLKVCASIEIGELFYPVSEDKKRLCYYLQQRSSLDLVVAFSAQNNINTEIVSIIRQINKNQAVYLLERMPSKDECFLPYWWRDLSFYINNHRLEDLRNCFSSIDKYFVADLSLIVGTVYSEPKNKLVVSLVLMPLIKNVSSAFAHYCSHLGVGSEEKYDSKNHGVDERLLEPIFTAIQTSVNALFFGHHPSNIYIQYHRTVEVVHSGNKIAMLTMQYLLYHELAHCMFHGSGKQKSSIPTFYEHKFRFSGSAEAADFFDRLIAFKGKPEGNLIRKPSFRRFGDEILASIVNLPEDLHGVAENAISKSELEELEADSWALNLLIEDCVTDKERGADFSEAIIAAYLAVLVVVAAGRCQQRKEGRDSSYEGKFSELYLIRMERLDNHIQSLREDIGVSVSIANAASYFIRAYLKWENNESKCGGVKMANLGTQSQALKVRFEFSEKDAADSAEDFFAKLSDDDLLHEKGVIFAPAGRMRGFGLGETFDLLVTVGNNHLDSIAIGVVTGLIVDGCKGGLKRLFINGQELRIDRNKFAAEVGAEVARALERKNTSDSAET